MARRSPRSQGPELDLSDVDHRVGKPIGGGQLWDPCSKLRHPPLGDGDATIPMQLWGYVRVRALPRAEHAYEA